MSAKRFAAFLLAALLPAFAGSAIAQSNGKPQPPASFTLQNGMQVVVIPDHRTPVVTHMIWYKVGSADETPGKSGLAHFLEHLMFKGTEKHPAGEFSKTVLQVGGNENAFTSTDYTGYYQRVPRDQLAKRARELMRDRARRSGERPTVDVADRLSRIRAPTLVIHARGDVVVPFAQGRELAAGIARFLDDRAEAQALGARARERCVERYSFEAARRALFPLVKQVMARR